MNNEQIAAVNAALRGHSFLLCGPAGTGKTFATNIIIDNLKAQGKQVIVASSTGISCAPFLKHNAQTVHKLFGLRDGRYTRNQLQQLYDEADDYYQPRKNKIFQTDCLVIDEISMISIDILDKVEHICRYVKKSNKVMGGIQTIFIGDFFQLPPISNRATGDTGLPCFHHDLFAAIVPHRIELLEVISCKTIKTYLILFKRSVDM